MGKQAKSERIAVVADSYWPDVCGDALRVGFLVSSLLRQGLEVDVVTPKRARSWPEFTRMEGVEVFRFDESAVMGLPLLRAAREAERLLTKLGRNYSAIYVDQPGRKWEPLIKKLRRKSCPVLVRFDPADLWKPEVNQDINEASIDSTLASVQFADAVLVSSADAERGVVSSDTNVIRVREQFAFPVDRSIGARREIRRSLGDASHELMSTTADRILVSIIGEQETRTLQSIVRQIGKLTEKHRRLRWWLLGNVSRRSPLHEQLKDEGWQYSIIMPGIMTDLESALQLADLVLVTSASSGQAAIADACIQNRIPFLLPQYPHYPTSLGEHDEEISSQVAFATQPMSADSNTRSRAGSLQSKVDGWLSDPSPLENGVLALQNKWFANQNISLQTAASAIADFARAKATP
ncbi:MAG: hypothetical protein AAGG44_14135 [Planctomycetota bacterium]